MQTATTCALTRLAARISSGVSPMKQTTAFSPSLRCASATPWRKISTRISQWSLKQPKVKYCRNPAAATLCQPTASRFPEATPSNFPAAFSRASTCGIPSHTFATIRFAFVATSRHTTFNAAGRFASKTSPEIPIRPSAARRIPRSVLP